MARSCWACGQQNDGGFTHCVNPACGLPLTAGRPGEPDTSIIRTRPCYLRMLALPAGITMVIILAAVHALTAPAHGPFKSGDPAVDAATVPSPAAAVTASPARPPGDGPVIFPLPGQVTTPRPSGPPAPPPPSAAADEGPVSGAYHLRSLSGGCFDIGYPAGQPPTVTQKTCSPGAPMARFDLRALGSGRYTMTAVPQRGIDAGQPLCVSSPGTDKPVTLVGCEPGRDDQLLLLVEISQDLYQVKVGGACLTASGRDARVKACGTSQAQRFTFTPIG